MMHEHWKQCNVCSQGKWVLGSALLSGVWWPGIVCQQNIITAVCL